ncbi:PRD domain-containing protein [Cronobacter sakazakii]|uniref:PRD domain-containing protein n=1 Tax=Cronobacter sakazakii TaxID=28141 RepID=UPI001375D099|nr:PRD domain-containing protein [Cronobacter sakazakii]
MRFPSQRLSRLFDLLQNETLPQDELARRLNVTTRTVRADISALNELLRQHGVQLVLNRGSGYQLTVDDMGRYQALQASRPKALRIPRTAPERVHYLAVRFLTSAFSLKLEDLAEEWFVSRATLQNDMAEVRELFTRYNLTLETRPRHGMKLFGSEMALRACLTDLLWQLAQQDSANPLITEEALNAGVQEPLAERLPTIFAHARLRFTDEGEQFIRLYCAVAVRRISEGFPLPEFVADDVDDNVREAARGIAALLQTLCGKPLSEAEENWLRVHIAARQVQELEPSAISADDAEALAGYILRYINTHYNYNLLTDEQLRADLLTHIRTMITRVRYQINIPNPLLGNIKQHYPMAWDMTLAAVSGWGKYTPYAISENEVGFLVLHIGVGLERHYNVGYQRNPRVLLVDRTRPWMLEKYFDARHFRVVDGPMTQQQLFKELCDELEQDGYVGADFLPSVVEREAIVSTMLGDGIALPHSLGLMARKTVVYTVLAPQGIAWGEETAHVIFLLAISKREYEEAMTIYDLFVTFLRERAAQQLQTCRDFAQFQAVAMTCLSRF